MLKSWKAAAAILNSERVWEVFVYFILGVFYLVWGVFVWFCFFSLWSDI